MLKSKREFTRFDLPLIVKFRPSYGATRYSLGLTKNFSFSGLGLEARDFNFKKNEHLEMEVKFPQSGSSVSLFGDVVWKRQVGSSSMAGIRLNIKDKKMQHDLMGKISSNWNIPLDSIIRKGDSDLDTAVAVEEIVSEKKVSKPVKKKDEAEPLPIKTIKKDEAEPQQPVQKIKNDKTETQAAPTGFIKKYLKNGSCKVTFRLPKEAAPDAAEIAIVGDFNDWDQSRTFMVRQKNGDFKVTLEIPAGREYRFKYLVDKSRWENDWQADKYVPNDFGSDDSVLSL